MYPPDSILATRKVCTITFVRQPKPAAPDAGRLRFLAAADRVYIQEGYDGATIRAITAEAGTSLARLNRHWTGKQNLFAEVFARHFTPIHNAQNASFDALEARDGDISRVGDILDSFFSPALHGVTGEEKQRFSYQIYCLALTDPSPEARELVAPLVKDVRARLIAKLRLALPQLDEEAFFFACSTVLGAYVYPQINGRRLAEAMGISYDAINWAGAGKRIAMVLEAGLVGPG